MHDGPQDDDAWVPLPEPGSAGGAAPRLTQDYLAAAQLAAPLFKYCIQQAKLSSRKNNQGSGGGPGLHTALLVLKHSIAARGPPEKEWVAGVDKFVRVAQSLGGGTTGGRASRRKRDRTMALLLSSAVLRNATEHATSLPSNVTKAHLIRDTPQLMKESYTQWLSTHAPALLPAGNSSPAVAASLFKVYEILVDDWLRHCQPPAGAPSAAETSKGEQIWKCFARGKQMARRSQVVLRAILGNGGEAWRAPDAAGAATALDALLSLPGEAATLRVLDEVASAEAHGNQPTAEVVTARCTACRLRERGVPPVLADQLASLVYPLPLYDHLVDLGRRHHHSAQSSLQPLLDALILLRKRWPPGQWGDGLHAQLFDAVARGWRDSVAAAEEEEPPAGESELQWWLTALVLHAAQLQARGDPADVKQPAQQCADAALDLDLSVLAAAWRRYGGDVFLECAEALQRAGDAGVLRALAHDAPPGYVLQCVNRTIETAMDYKCSSRTLRTILLHFFPSLDPAVASDCEAHLGPAWSNFALRCLDSEVFAEPAHVRTQEEIVEHLVKHCGGFQREGVDVRSIFLGIIGEVTRSPPDVAHMTENAVHDCCVELKKQNALEPCAAETRRRILHTVFRGAELYMRAKKKGSALHLTQRIAAHILFLRPFKGKNNEVRNVMLQMLTGEGKSIVVAMAATCFALAGHAVDVAVSSIELAARDADEMQPLYSVFALRASALSEDAENNASAYCDPIVYGDASSLNGDYLRTQLGGNDIRGKRPLDACIADEVDHLCVDGRNTSVQLSETNPSAGHLLPVMIVMWKAASECFRHLIKEQAGAAESGASPERYFFVPEPFAVVDGAVTLFDASRRYEDVREAVADPAEFIAGRCLKAAQWATRDEQPGQKERYEKFCDTRNALMKGASSEKTDTAAVRAAVAEVEQLTNNTPSEYQSMPLQVPPHMTQVLADFLPKCAHSAARALLSMERDRDYAVIDGEIVPLDYSNTGTAQLKTVWSNGLHQFLQLKERVHVTPPGFTSIFLSYVGFFTRYRILSGITGTLGTPGTREWLHHNYRCATAALPAHLTRPLAPVQAPWPRDSPQRYLGKELSPVAARTPRDAIKSAVNKAVWHAAGGGAVLLLVKHIEQAEAAAAYIEQRLESWEQDRIHVSKYTALHKLHKAEVDSGDILVATNIAGRGTDLRPSSDVEELGGLRVLITFLPEIERVEMQNAGRTSRQGRKGAVQLFMYPEHDVAADVAAWWHGGGGGGGEGMAKGLRAVRDAREKALLQAAQRQVHGMLFQDDLLHDFISVSNTVLSGADNRCDFLIQVGKAQQELQAFVEEGLNTQSPAYKLDRRAWKREQRGKAAGAKQARAAGAFSSVSSLSSLSESSSDDDVGGTLDKTDEAQDAAFQESYRQTLQERFVNVATEKGWYSKDVIDEALASSDVRREIKMAATKRSEEEEGLREQWAFWLHALPYSIHDFSKKELIRELFDQFLSDVNRRGAESVLIRNPHFYVHLGVRQIAEGECSSAVGSLDKAIRMDPNFTFMARYYKAVALLRLHSSQLSEPLKELKEAARLLKEVEIAGAVSVVVMLSGEGGETAAVVAATHSLNIYEGILNIIQQTIKTLEEISESKSGRCDTSAKTTTLEKLLPTMDGKAAEDALYAVRRDGFWTVYSFSEHVNVPWGTVATYALLGVVGTGAGAAAIHYGFGSIGAALIATGVADCIHAVATVKTKEEFKFSKWVTSKAVDLTISALSFGVAKIAKSAKTGLYCVQNRAMLSSISYGGPGLATVVWEQIASQALVQGSSTALQMGITKVLDDLTQNCEVWEGLFRTAVQQQTATLVGSDDSVRQCIDADVARQSMQWELKLRNYVLPCTHAMLRESEKGWMTGKGTFLECGEEYVKQVGAQGVKKLLTPSGTGGAVLGGVANAGTIPIKVINLKNSIPSFYSGYKTAIGPLGVQAKKALESGSTGKAGEAMQGIVLETAAPTGFKTNGEDVLDCFSSEDANRAGRCAAVATAATRGGTYVSEARPVSQAGVLSAARTPDGIRASLTTFINHTLLHALNMAAQKQVNSMVASYTSSIVANNLCEDVVKRANELLDNYTCRRDRQCTADHAATHGAPDGTSRKVSEGDVELAQTTAQRALDGKEGGLGECASIAKKWNRPVHVFDQDGNLIAVVGHNNTGGPPMRLRYAAVDIDGVTKMHYDCMDKKSCFAGKRNAETDCLYVAMLESLTSEERAALDVHSVSDVRRTAASGMVENPAAFAELHRDCTRVAQYDVSRGHMEGGSLAAILIPIVRRIAYEAMKIILVANGVNGVLYLSKRYGRDIERTAQEFLYHLCLLSLESILGKERGEEAARAMSSEIWNHSKERFISKVAEMREGSKSGSTAGETTDKSPTYKEQVKIDRALKAVQEQMEKNHDAYQRNMKNNRQKNKSAQAYHESKDAQRKVQEHYEQRDAALEQKMKVLAQTITEAELAKNARLNQPSEDAPSGQKPSGDKYKTTFVIRHTTRNALRVSSFVTGGWKKIAKTVVLGVGMDAFYSAYPRVANVLDVPNHMVEYTFWAYDWLRGNPPTPPTPPSPAEGNE